MSKWLNIVGARLRGLLGRERVIGDIDKEFRSHVEMVTEENVRRGMRPDEARREAQGLDRAGQNLVYGERLHAFSS